MTWDRPSADRSPQSEGHDTSEFELSLASLVQLRGQPLLEALERHRPGSRTHADASASYAFATAVELGFERRRAESVREAARLHEIGSIYVPAALEAKPIAELTEAERTQLGQRFQAGRDLAIGAAIPERVCDWILHFGERWDGRGPGGRGGEAIPVEARIVRAACDCDVAMSALGDGGAEAGHIRAIRALRAGSGTELDPEVADALVAVLERAAGGS